MLSTPCKYCTLSSHFINSLLLTVDPKEIDDFLSDEAKEINKLRERAKARARKSLQRAFNGCIAKDD